MPELPEVQTVVNDLQTIVGDSITGFWSDFEKGIKTKEFGKKITGQEIIRIFRSGKNIVITLKNGHSIIVHLKMTGQLLLKVESGKLKVENNKDADKYEKYVHHIFYLGKNHTLNFSDIRKFGTLELADEKTLAEKISTKGLDPFSVEYTFKNFQLLLVRGKNKTSHSRVTGKNLKQFLMDQSFISGIGNIYASEIPFDAKLSPLRKINSFNTVESKKLFSSIKKILSKAIKLRGTSFSDYRDANGKTGSFQKFLKVYGKAGKKCPTCDTIVHKVIIGQRSTFYCPKCQK